MQKSLIEIEMEMFDSISRVSILFADKGHEARAPHLQSAVGIHNKKLLEMEWPAVHCTIAQTERQTGRSMVFAIRIDRDECSKSEVLRASLARVWPDISSTIKQISSSVPLKYTLITTKFKNIALTHTHTHTHRRPNRQPLRQVRSEQHMPTAFSGNVHICTLREQHKQNSEQPVGGYGSRCRRRHHSRLCFSQTLESFSFLYYTSRRSFAQAIAIRRKLNKYRIEITIHRTRYFFSAPFCAISFIEQFHCVRRYF